MRRQQLISEHGKEKSQRVAPGRRLQSNKNVRFGNLNLPT